MTAWRPSSESCFRVVQANQGLKTEETMRCREPISDSRWQELLTVLKRDLHSLDLEPIRLLAGCIAGGIRSLDATMTEYCRLTCPTCEDPCCRGLKVFFNQTDLLYLVALGEQLPVGQTRAHESAPCRYLSERGCLLPRVARPYVCVWFLCEAQMELFQAEPAPFQRQFIMTMQDIRACRLSLESLYEGMRLVY